MIEFKPVRLEDRAVIERYTMPSGICNCDLAFANMYCWQAVFHSAWAEIGGFLVIRFQIDGGERIGYMQPVGEGDFGPILPLLREDAWRVIRCNRYGYIAEIERARYSIEERKP